MKGCFLLQRNFAYIGHYLAVLLKERYGIEDFCGYVYVRKMYNFLKSQHDINYSLLLLDQEVHARYRNEKLDLPYLQWLERTYGIPNLWPYLAVDRVVMHNQLVREYPYDTPRYTHEEMLRILQVKAKAVINFLESERPDFVFLSVIGGIGSMLLYHIARKKGIRTIIVHPTSIRDTYVLSDTYTGFSGVERIFKNQEQPSHDAYARARGFLDEFRKNPQPHYELAHPQKQPTTRHQQFDFVKPKNFARNIRWIAKYFYWHFTRDDIHDYDYIGPWNYLKDALRRKMRNLVGVGDLYDAYDPNENFAFFPLHYEPEITLLLYAPFFTDQSNLIKHIARSLPVGMSLYVKEHPAMVPYRPRSYYQQLKKIPNVKLIAPTVASFDILPHAKLVTTITSTVGWEAALLGKPVVTFGEIFYNQLSFVKKCRALEDLPLLVKHQLEKFAYDEAELIRFIATIFDEAASLNLQFLWERERDLKKKKEGLVSLANLLAKKLNLTPLSSNHTQ